MTRTTLFACMVLAATQVPASFDLMYLPNETQNGIQRWDPVNRVSLGGFDTPTMSHVAAHRSTSTIVVNWGGSTQFYYNGSTGEASGYSTGANIQTSTHSSDGTTYWGSPGATVVRNSHVTGAQSNSFGVSGGMTVRALAEVGSNIAVVGYLGSDIVARLYSSTGSLLSSTTVATGVGASANVGSMTYVTGNGGNNLVTGYWNTSGSYSLVRFSVVGTTIGGSSSSLSTVTFDTASSSYVSVMAGHGGTFWAVGRDISGTSTRIRQFSIPFGNITSMGSYTTTAVSVPQTARWNGANIVAPEPGTLAAFGIGAWGFLRKSKRRSA